jgi:hypothetical protein
LEEPIVVDTYPPVGELVPSCRHNHKEVIVAESRRRFGRPRARVEERIGRFLARPVVITVRRRVEKRADRKSPRLRAGEGFGMVPRY